MSEPTIEVIDLAASDDIEVLEVTQGVIPVKGDKGDPGERGPAGPQGEPGLAGRDGIDGRDGLPGAAGAQGERGPQGDKGVPGRDGLDGQTGLPGADGATGAQGPQGEQGLPGRDGRDGLDGVDGKNGADGAAGPIGPQGERGLAGEPGAKGDPGAAGPKGDRGDPGAPGIDGVDGQDGAPGAKGETGATGPAGPQGEQGPEGPQGVQGEPGPTGPKGDTGATGPAGSSTLSVPGTNSSILYRNSASSLGGNTKMLVRVADNGFQLDGVVVKPMSEASHPFVQVTDQYGLPGNRTLGTHEGFGSSRIWQASDGTNAFNRAMPNITAGTPTAQAISNARWLDEPTINYVTAASAGSQAAWIGTAPVLSSNQTATGGFQVMIRFSVKNFAQGKRWFVGLVGNPVVPDNTNTAAMANVIGVGADAGDTNVYLFTNGGSGSMSRSQQAIPATLNGETITFVLTSFPAQAQVKCGFQFGGYGWGTSLSYNGLLYPAAWVSTGTTSAPITLSLNRVYAEYLTNN